MNPYIKPLKNSSYNLVSIRSQSTELTPFGKYFSGKSYLYIQQEIFPSIGTHSCSVTSGY